MECANCSELGKVRIDADTIVCEECFDLFVRLNRK